MATKETLQTLLYQHPMLFIEKMLEKQASLKLSIEEFVVLQYVWLEIAQGNDAPSNVFLAERTALTEEKVRASLLSLMKQKIILVQSFDSNGKTREAYDISHFISTCFDTKIAQPKASNQMKDFVGRIETEFTRKLSPIEIRLIESWVYDEQIDYVTLDEALTETILTGVKNLKYMNAIVQDWQKNKVIHTKKHPNNVRKESFSEEEKAVAEIDWVSDLGELDD